MINYVKEAVRTESPYSHPVSMPYVDVLLLDFIIAAKKLDGLKKALFYGKDLTKYQSGYEGQDLILTERQRRLLHAAIGMGTEAGELVEALHTHLFTDKPLDEVNLKEELGDVNWYQAIACDELEITLDDVLETNIEKLRKRYPEKFTAELAENRDLEGERKILEA